jgi:hypothetical protein
LAKHNTVYALIVTCKRSMALPIPIQNTVKRGN